MLGLEIGLVNVGVVFKYPGGTETELAGSLVQAKFHTICKHPTSRTLIDPSPNTWRARAQQGGSARRPGADEDKPFLPRTHLHTPAVPRTQVGQTAA